MSRRKIETPGQQLNETFPEPIPSKEELKDSLFDIYDLVKMFGVERGTIYNWCKKGLLKYIQFGGRRYFNKKDVHEALNKYKQTLVPGEGKKK